MPKLSKPFTWLLIFAFVCIEPGYAQFRQLYHGTDTTNEIRGVSFFSATAGFIAFKKYVGYTTDSGHSFAKYYITTSNVDYNGYSVNLTIGFNPLGVKAFNSTTLLVYGDYFFEPAILYSSNSGISWKLIYHRNLRYSATYLLKGITDMEFPGNGNIGFAIDGEEVLKTTDNGQSWYVVKTDWDQQLIKLSFPSALTGYAIGLNRLLKTSDGGISWQILNGLPAMSNIFFTSNTNGYIFTNGGFIHRTINGGNSFNQVNQDETRIGPADIYFMNDSTGFAALHPYRVMKTRNYGKTWELSKGSDVYQISSYGFNCLFFYNGNIGWTGGEREYLEITSNGGGTPAPKAVFHINTSSVCTNNIIYLENLSYEHYNYKWFRNGKLISTNYNTNYIAQSQEDTLKLVVSAGVQSDSSTQYVSAGTNTLALTASIRDTIVCSNRAIYADIYNTDPQTQYQIGSRGQYNLPQYGNGGILTLIVGIPWESDGDEIIKLFANRQSSCGPQNIEKDYTVHAIQSYFSIAGYIDSFFCPQKTVNLYAVNSRIGWNYWCDTGLASVPGNGGTIAIPTRASAAAEANLGSGLYQFILHATNQTYGCYNGDNNNLRNTTARYSKAHFSMYGHEYFAGDSLSFNNTSELSPRSRWIFDSTASAGYSEEFNPSKVNFTKEGQKLIKLLAYSQEGCVDSSSLTIEIFKLLQHPPPVLLCNLGSGTGDSLKGPYYYIDRDLYSDEEGNSYATGGSIPFLEHFNFSPTGLEGYFIVKYDAQGTVKWKLEQQIDQSSNLHAHIITEQIVADKHGNTYVYGHSYGGLYITDSSKSFSLPYGCSFILKLNTRGKIAYVNTFYNAASSYFGGTLLMGKNKDLYIITEMRRGFDFYMNTQKLFPIQSLYTGVIIHLDLKGKLLDTKQFPAEYNDLNNGSGNYDRFPRAMFDAKSRIAFYVNLRKSEMTKGYIDDAVVNFDVNKITSAILFYDTASHRIVSAKPIFKNDSLNNSTGFQPFCFTLDSAGNYYASTAFMIDILQSSKIPAVKLKGLIIAFDSSGKQSWRKQTEGLEADNLLVVDKHLFVLGKNYVGEGFSLAQYIYDAAASPILPNTRKLTAISSLGSYIGTGIYGRGSLDIIIAKLQLTNGSVEAMSSFGTAREQEIGVLKKGFGNQLFFGGSGNYLIRSVLEIKDTAGFTFIKKIAVDRDCGTETFTLSQATKSIAESKTNYFKIMPNPANNYFFITGGSNIFNKINLIIRNSAGQLVVYKDLFSTSSTRINIASLPKGIYFVTISTKDVIQTNKLIIAR